MLVDTIAVEDAQSTAAVIRTGSVALSTLLVTGTVSVVAGLAFWLGPKLYLRFSGREPEANVSRAPPPSFSDATATASRPGLSSGFPQGFWKLVLGSPYREREERRFAERGASPGRSRIGASTG